MKRVNQLVLFYSESEYAEARKTFVEATKAQRNLKVLFVFMILTLISITISFVLVCISNFYEIAKEIPISFCFSGIVFIFSSIYFWLKRMKFPYPIKYNLERCTKLMSEYEANPV